PIALAAFVACPSSDEIWPCLKDEAKRNIARYQIEQLAAVHADFSKRNSHFTRPHGVAKHTKEITMHIVSKFMSSAALATSIAAFGLAPTASSAATVAVTPSSMGNWAFDNRDAAGVVGAESTASGGMVTGPATPPLGIGSANLATGNGTIGG